MPGLAGMRGRAERIRTRVRRPHFAPLISREEFRRKRRISRSETFLARNGFPEIGRRRFPYHVGESAQSFAILTACQPGSVSARQSPGL
ncbi:MAG: hypothetical protein QOJ42_4039 [Acidobacteriaceae bacterium]|jgi:hypothetical protein|nr:hypothetical protein [Acidobacteriaceae bacterium]